MPSTELIKLAPTLSAEERYRILIPDTHRQLDGEPSLISESELKALTRFENRAIWEAYTRRLSMMKWAQALWPQAIEAEKLRVVVFYMKMSFSFERILLDGDRTIPKDERAAQFDRLKEAVAEIGEHSESFYAHREAIERIRGELYGVPLFNGKRMAGILEAYTGVDEMIEHHDKFIREACANGIIRNHIKPIVKDVDSYLVTKPVPGEELIEAIMEEVRHIAGLDVESLSR